MQNVNGKQIPLGGSLFTGIFGNEPTQIEQKLRSDMILIAQRYAITDPNTATNRLIALKQQLNGFDASQSETIAKAKKDVLAIENRACKNNCVTANSKLTYRAAMRKIRKKHWTNNLI